MPSQVMLAYVLDVGNQLAAPGTKLYIKAANVIWDPLGETSALIGMENTGLAQSYDAATNTIRIELTYALTAQGQSAFPTEELVKKATRNLFGRVWEHAMPAKVTAEDPVVS